MANRFRKRRVATNTSSDYKDSDIFENRGVKKIKFDSTTDKGIKGLGNPGAEGKYI